jgi:DNA invertase Pin-like site-specific DNA recombinase
LEAQQKSVSEFVKGKGGLFAEYTEIESGKHDYRPQLTAAITATKSNNATLIIAKLDRLSRNAAFILNLRNSGIKFVCCDLPDANTMTIGVFAAIAQHEREIISQRTKAALEAKKARGERLGNSHDFTNEERAKAAEVIRAKAANNAANKTAFALANEMKATKSCREIADHLNKNGFKTPHGKKWTGCGALRLLRNYKQFNDN